LRFPHESFQPLIIVTFWFAGVPVIVKNGKTQTNVAVAILTYHMNPLSPCFSQRLNILNPKKGGKRLLHFGFTSYLRLRNMYAPIATTTMTMTAIAAYTASIGNPAGGGGSVSPPAVGEVTDTAFHSP